MPPLQLHLLRTALAVAASLAIGAPLAARDLGTAVSVASIAPSDAAQVLPQVQVAGHHDLNGVGTSDAVSQGSATASLIESRPSLRPADVLEFVPGLVVTQHSGEGKANQYFLRGFNLDHGTDFATFVGGMPVNMPTHAHGHGYSDLNWLIPELVDRIDYRKGPYHAGEGDFSAAGAAHIRLFDTLPHGIASITLGENGYRRGLAADSSRLAEGELLYALEGTHNDGPWDQPEKFHRLGGMLRYSFGPAQSRSSITAMAYSAGWNASDQIPQRAVDGGLIGRFGTIDPTDGGRTGRTSLSDELQHQRDDGAIKFNAYAIRSRLDLFSNFSYALQNPSDLGPAANPSGIAGDQFEQAERRRTHGFALERSWDTTLAGHETTHRIGLQWRHDRLDPVGLYSTESRTRVATVQESRVRQASASLYLQNETQWRPWLRSVAGVRADHFDFDVKSSIAGNSGQRSASIVSPKLSVVLGPWHKTETFVNWGLGFHSNDARGTTATISPGIGGTIVPVNPLVRAKGAEIGLRTQIVPGLQSSLSLWQLSLASELVFVGDAGDVQANRGSKRHGIEWDSHYRPNDWLSLDLGVAASRARFTPDDPAGNRIPGAIDKVVSVGATVNDLGRWFGHVELRHVGSRPLVEDNSQRSAASTLASARIGTKLGKDVNLALDVFNLFDREASDIEYHYRSRLKGEAAGGVEDRHFHPVEPRSVRLTLTAKF
jgi:outer membrane receptor for Fe3+-dicitrate